MHVPWSRVPSWGAPGTSGVFGTPTGKTEPARPDVAVNPLQDKENDVDVEMTTAVPYEPPALVEVGGFSEDTLGWGHWFFDGYREGER